MQDITMISQKPTQLLSDFLHLLRVNCIDVARDPQRHGHVWHGTRHPLKTHIVVSNKARKDRDAAAQGGDFSRRQKLSEAVVSLAGFTLSPIHLDAIDRANGPAIVSQFMTSSDFA